jgi:hypothetical protein
MREERNRNRAKIGMERDYREGREQDLKVVTNEKGEAVGEVVTIICKWGRWCWMFFCHFNGLPSCMNSYLSFR